jgi:DNA-binding GntR family transcriptional regulator
MRALALQRDEAERDGYDDLPTVDRSSLADRVTVLIRQAIVSGVLQAGEPIGVREVARRLGVSPTPVREALFQLRGIGLVEFLPGRVRIVAPTPEALREAFELREALEGMAARLAAERRDAADLERIEHWAGASRIAAGGGDAASFRAADSEFHEAVAAAARSEQLRRYLKNALDLALTLRNLRNNRGPRHPNPPFAYMHQLIAQAIRAGDAAEAERLGREHVRRVCELIGGKPQGETAATEDAHGTGLP